MFDALIIGSGLAGLVCARELAEKGYKVRISERREHIGGNIYDEVDDKGFLIQRYGPHSFYTNDKSVKEYIERYIETEEFYARCRTVIRGQRIPMPFNYQSVDMIYDEKKADSLKRALKKEFPGRDKVSVTELINCDNYIVSEYGNFMYDNEYRKYTSKQWDMNIESISPEVFHRVPVYLSYRDIYQAAEYQFMPKGGFTRFAKALSEHNNITISYNEDLVGAQVCIEENNIYYYDEENRKYNIPIVYTGEIDALINYKYGKLPYRSLEFIWKYYNRDEFQDSEITAYPEADKITRITEYKKFPPQDVPGRTVISIEIPMKYDNNSPVGNIPYYPVKNRESDIQYDKYIQEASKIKNLFLCGRLAEFKYYDMDSVIKRAKEVAVKVERELV